MEMTAADSHNAAFNRHPRIEFTCLISPALWQVTTHCSKPDSCLRIGADIMLHLQVIQQFKVGI
jgi:hypothetical protein